MSDITINYKGNAIATMDASGTKTLLTDGKYCEDDIEVVYVKPGGGGSSVLSGTFTPASDTATVTISALAGTTLDHLLIKVSGVLDNAKVSGKRSVVFAFFDFSTPCFAAYASNSSGSTLSQYLSSATSANNTHYEFNRTTGVFTCLKSTSNGGGVFPSGVEYTWYAW